MQEQTQQVNIQKTFNVPKEALYKAWTEESQLKQWNDHHKYVTCMHNA